MWRLLNFCVINDQGFHPTGRSLIVIVHGNWRDGKRGVELGPRVAQTPFGFEGFAPGLSPMNIFGCAAKQDMLLFATFMVPECIYNPITAMGFWAMFTFQVDNTKR